MKTVLGSVLIVDDVAEMREYLKVLLEAAPGIRVSGLAANTWEARAEISRRRPDLVLLDEILPGESSADLMKELLTDGLRVLLMTGVEQPTHEVLPGACGRIRKPNLDRPSKDDQKSLVDGVTKQLT